MIRSRTAATLVLLTGLALPAQVLAEETPTTGVAFDEASKAQSFQATQLYKAALADFNRGRHEQALKRFRESYGVVKSPNTRLMIVRSLAGLERNVEAFEEAIALQAEAEAAAAKADKYAEVIDAAQIELEALAPKLALVVVFVDAPEDATVTLGGEPLPPERWGRPFPVEPGTIEVVLASPKGEIRESGTAAIGEQLELTLVPKAAPPPKKAAPATAPPDTATSGYDGPDRRILALAAGGVGVLGMVNFGIFGMLANGQFERLEIRCDGSTCDPDLEEEADTGRTYQTVANVSVGIGAAFLAAGAGLFLWDLLDTPAETSETSWRPTIEVGPGTVVVSGSF